MIIGGPDSPSDDKLVRRVNFEPGILASTP